MLDNELDFLNCTDPPTIFTAQQTAWRLNVPLKAIPKIIKAGFLIPLGRPAQNGPKSFYRDDVLALSQDRKSMCAVVECVQLYWREKNARKEANKAKRRGKLPPDSSV